MRRTNQDTRRAVAVGALGVLAVSAFLLGAALAGPGPVASHVTGPNRAPGRAAAAERPAEADDVSPAAASGPHEPATTPGPPRPSEGPLTVTVSASDLAPSTGQDVRLRIRWRDGSGRYAGLTEDWGDGTASSSLRAVSCRGAPGAHRGDLESTHRFPAGRYRVRMSVTTADCHGRTETRAGEIVLNVGSTEPAPVDVDETGSPTASPEPQVVPQPVETLPTELPAVPTDAPTHLIRTGEAERTDSDTP
ncbi:hypothetical protein [Cryptosporangium sp. NPDC051539]|uniref:hypothetical protein n=1 Tax=Cryptosporangium sp. NPDC051539 TaxID=3363962 RepID=UPI0037B7C90A